MNAGQVIKTLRASAGLTQFELATRVGISPSFLSLLESNRRDPTVSVLRRIGNELGVPPSVLIAAALDSDTEAASVEELRVKQLLESLVRAANHLVLANKLDREDNHTQTRPDK